VGVDRVGIYDAIPYVVGAVLLSLLTLTQRVWFHVVVLAGSVVNFIQFLFLHSSDLDTRWIG
jgi:hypothetical protein